LSSNISAVFVIFCIEVIILNSYELNENDNTDSDKDNRVIVIDDYPHKQKNDDISDIFAFQSVICILAATTFLILNVFFPDECSEVYFEFLRLIKSNSEIIKNPLNML